MSIFRKVWPYCVFLHKEQQTASLDGVSVFLEYLSDGGTWATQLEINSLAWKSHLYLKQGGLCILNMLSFSDILN